MRRPERLAGLLGLVLGLLHWWLAPDSGTDLAAQLARASFARTAPFTPVDLSWYGGMHPFGYSLLSPWVMALLGVQLSGLLAAVLGSVLLARLLRDSARPMLGALVGTVFVVADVTSGRMTFALGAVAGLAALVALPRRRWVVLFGVLTGLLSPVAAAFVGFVAAVLVLHRRPCGWSLGLAASVPVAVLSLLFGEGGTQPFSAHSARPAVLAALAVALLTSVPVVRTAALLYAVAVIAFVIHHDPFGSNALRLGLLVSAATLVATARRRTWLVLTATGLILSWQVGPTWADLRAGAPPPLGALRAELEHLDADRVEVVAPRDHREAWYIAEQVPLARGWSRQQDYALNRLFYDGRLSPTAYLTWLREHSVDHVALPLHATLDFGSATEGALLRGSTVPGLEPVWRDDQWVVYQVSDPAPFASPPGRVIASGRTTIVLDVTPGLVTVRIRWSPWLTVSGPACLERYGDGVRLRVRAAGVVVVGSSLLPRGHC